MAPRVACRWLGVVAMSMAVAQATAEPDTAADDKSEVQQTLNDFDKLQKNDAGNELFVLATNFLLYIALVILTILLQKMYFPHTVPDEDHPAQVVAPDEEEMTEPMVPLNKGVPLDDLPDQLEPEKLEVEGKPMMRRSSSLSDLAAFIDFQNFNQERMTKKQVLGRLFNCAVGLNVSFLVWGILQERMLTRPYNGEYFSSSYGLVFLNRLGGFIISGIMLYAFKPPHTSAVVYEFSFPSVSNMLSSWTQYEALKYVSFPTQMLFKCFKLVPIMLMGKFLGNKSYPAYDYVVCFMIGFGIAIFMVSTEDMEFGTDSIGTPETWSGTICGMMLLCFFLVFDSFTGQWQSRMFSRHQDLSPFHMMFAVNTFSMIFSFITLVHTKELEQFVEFVMRHPEMHFHVMIFSICSTVGQLYIFQTIRNFGAVVFAIIMNTRIILSIVFSCVIYSHPISSQGSFGLFIVFASIAYRIKRKTQGRELIRWRTHISHGSEWFHEVHEHLDM